MLSDCVSPNIDFFEFLRDLEHQLKIGINTDSLDDFYFGIIDAVRQEVYHDEYSSSHDIQWNFKPLFVNILSQSTLSKNVFNEVFRGQTEIVDEIFEKLFYKTRELQDCRMFISNIRVTLTEKNMIFSIDEYDTDETLFKTITYTTKRKKEEKGEDDIGERAPSCYFDDVDALMRYYEYFTRYKSHINHMLGVLAGCYKKAITNKTPNEVIDKVLEVLTKIEDTGCFYDKSEVIDEIREFVKSR